MIELVSTVLPYIAPSALPVVIVAIVCFYIYRKIGNERKETKAERDNDSREIHDKILKHDFEIANLKGIVVEHKNTLEDLREQVAILNTNIVKLTVVVENLTKSWRGEK